MNKYPVIPLLNSRLILTFSLRFVGQDEWEMILGKFIFFEYLATSCGTVNMQKKKAKLLASRGYSVITYAWNNCGWREVMLDSKFAAQT